MQVPACFFDIHNSLLPNIVFKEVPMVDESIDVPIDDAEETKSEKKPTKVEEGSTNPHKVVSPHLTAKEVLNFNQILEKTYKAVSVCPLGLLGP